MADLINNTSGFSNSNYYFTKIAIPSLESHTPAVISYGRSIQSAGTRSNFRLLRAKYNTSAKLKASSSLTVLTIPPGAKVAGWQLSSVLLVQILRSRKESVATTWLEGITEYGVSEDDNEATKDLVVSLGEYRESLERRENDLGRSAKNELAYLRKLISRAPQNPS